MNKEGNFVLLGIASLVVVFVLSLVSASSNIIQVSDVEVPLPSDCELLLNSTSGDLVEVRINQEEGVFYFKYQDDKKRFSAGEYSVCFDELKNIQENGESIVGNVKIVDLNSISISKFGITGNAVAGKKKDTTKTVTAESTTASPKKNKAAAVPVASPTESVVRTSASFDGTVTTPTAYPQIDALVDYRGGKYFDFADRKRSNVYIGSDELVYFQRPNWGDMFTDYLLSDVKIGAVSTSAAGSFVQLDDNAKDYLGEDLFNQLNYRAMPKDLATSDVGIVGSVKNALNTLNGNNAKAAGTKSSGSRVNTGAGSNGQCANTLYAVTHPKKCPSTIVDGGDCTDETYWASHLSECYELSVAEELCTDASYAAANPDICIVIKCSKAKYAKANPDICNGEISNPCIDEAYAAANPDLCGGEVGDCSNAKYANANQGLCCVNDASYASAHPKLCGKSTASCTDSCSQQCGVGTNPVFLADSSSGGGGIAYPTATIAGAVVTPLPTINTQDCYTNCVSSCQGKGGSSSGGSSGSSGRGGSGGGTSGGGSGGGSSGKGGTGGGKTGKTECSSGEAAKTVKCPKGEEGLYTQECKNGQWVDGVNNCKAKSDAKDCTTPIAGKNGAVSKSYESCPANPTTTYSATCKDGTWIPDLSKCASKDCTSSSIGTVKDGATKSDYGVCKDGKTKYPATCTKGTMVENKNICPDYGGCSVGGKIFENDAIIDNNKCLYCSEGKSTDYCVEQGKGEVCGGSGKCIAKDGGCTSASGKSYKNGEKAPDVCDEDGKTKFDWICKDGTWDDSDQKAKCNAGKGACTGNDGKIYKIGEKETIPCDEADYVGEGKTYTQTCSEGKWTGSTRNSVCDDRKGLCSSDNDCTSADAKKCEPESGKCVQCLVTETDCPYANMCTADYKCICDPNVATVEQGSVWGTGEVISPFSITGFAVSGCPMPKCGDGACTSGEQGKCKQDCNCDNPLYKMQHAEECDKKKPGDEPKNPDKPASGESESGGGGGARMTAAAIFRTGKPVFGYGR